MDCKDKIIKQVSPLFYELPENRIAKFPIEPRDGSNLLVYKNGEIEDRRFYEISEYLNRGDLLVYNNTRVIHARLGFRKATGAAIEIFCLEPIQPTDYQINFANMGVVRWKCIVGNARKWKQGTLEQIFDYNARQIRVEASQVAKNDDGYVIEFRWEAQISFGELIEELGKIPIPPYLSRNSEDSDLVNYQTVYSRISGSVAAPTAGLHFTDQVLKSIDRQGVSFSEITLHVGAGTFKPIGSDDIGKHRMHAEHIYVGRKNLLLLKKHLGQVVAVGTTSMRCLESLYWIALRLHRGVIPDEGEVAVNQWEPYEAEAVLSPLQALDVMLDYMSKSGQDSLHFVTEIMIIPGYKFNFVDRLITNFHQPKSTLLLLVAAFVGEDWKKIYEHALDNQYRFLSYGDSSLLYKKSVKYD